MSNIDKQALIAKIKKQTESYDTVVLREDEANALLDELEDKENDVSRLNAALKWLTQSRASFAETSITNKVALEAAEKRIAELEARKVTLPERYEVEMCPTPSPDGDWYSREDVLAALETAGLKVAAAGKGEAS